MDYRSHNPENKDQDSELIAYEKIPQVADEITFLIHQICSQNQLEISDDYTYGEGLGGQIEYVETKEENYFKSKVCANYDESTQTPDFFDDATIIITEAFIDGVSNRRRNHHYGYRVEIEKSERTLFDAFFSLEGTSHPADQKVDLIRLPSGLDDRGREYFDQLSAQSALELLRSTHNWLDSIIENNTTRYAHTDNEIMKVANQIERDQKLAQDDVTFLDKIKSLLQEGMMVRGASLMLNLQGSGERGQESEKTVYVVDANCKAESGALSIDVHQVEVEFVSDGDTTQLQIVPRDQKGRAIRSLVTDYYLDEGGQLIMAINQSNNYVIVNNLLSKIKERINNNQ